MNMQKLFTDDLSVNTKANDLLNKIFNTKMDYSNPVVKWVGKSEAEQLLSTNTKNRKIKKSHVKWLSKQMELGYWVFCGQVIGLDVNACLINLQHTLSAIVLSNTKQKFIVMCGFEERAIEVMDTGVARTAGDVLHMNGIPNANLIAATIRKMMNFNNKDASSIYVGGSSQTDNRRNNAGGGRSRYTSSTKDLISNTTVLEIVNRDKVYWIEHSKEAKKMYSQFPVVSSSFYGFIYHEMKQKDSEEAYEFMSKFSNGTGLKKGSPILVLRQKFEKEMFSKLDHSSREKIYWFIYCWNKFRLGDSLYTINKYDSKQPLPDFL